MPWCLQANRKVPVWLYNATHSDVWEAKISPQGRESEPQSSAFLYDTINGNSTFEHLQHALEAGQFIQRLYKVWPAVSGYETIQLLYIMNKCKCQTSLLQTNGKDAYKRLYDHYHAEFPDRDFALNKSWQKLRGLAKSWGCSTTGLCSFVFEMCDHMEKWVQELHLSHAYWQQQAQPGPATGNPSTILNVPSSPAWLHDQPDSHAGPDSPQHDFASQSSVSPGFEALQPSASDTPGQAASPVQAPGTQEIQDTAMMVDEPGSLTFLSDTEAIDANLEFLLGDIGMDAEHQGMPSEQLHSTAAYDTAQLPQQPPPYGMLPAAQEQSVFVGRTQLMEELTCLINSAFQGIIRIWGGAGMGKTSLATTCAQSMCESRAVGRWFHADLTGLATLDDALAQIKDAISIGHGMQHQPWPPAKVRSSCDAMTQHLCKLLQARQDQMVLLVLDNADDILHDEVLQRILRGVQYHMQGLKLLSTSRNKVTWHEGPVHNVHLQALEQHDALELLEVFTPARPLTPAMATQLAELCGSIPYALKVAAQNIQQGCTAEDMVLTLKKVGLVKGMKDLGQDERLRTCIMPSLKTERAALACLSIFPGKFDEKAAAAVLGSEVASARQKLLVLQSLSLVEKVSTGSSPVHQPYSMHLLLRELAAEGIEADTAVAAEYVLGQQRFMHHFLGVWKAAQQDTLQSQQCLLHMWQSVDKAIAMLATQELLHQPRVYSSYCSLGRIPLDTTFFKLKTDTVTKALEKLLAWAQQDGSAEDKLAAQEQLAYFRSDDPKLCELAEKDLTEVLDKREAMVPRDDYSLITCLEGLANVAVLMECIGKLPTSTANADCDRHRSRAADILHATRDLDDPETLRSDAWVAYGLSDIDNSVQDLQRLLIRAQGALPEGHPATFCIQSQLAHKLCDATRDQMCETARALCGPEAMADLERNGGSPMSFVLLWLQEHLKLCQDRMFGDVHHETVLAELSLGTACTRCNEGGQHDMEAGMQHIVKGIEAAKICWGPYDEWTLDVTLEVQVAALQRLGKYDEALGVVKATMELGKEGFGDKSEYIASCKQIEARLQQLMGNYLEAEGKLNAVEFQLRAAHGHDVKELSLIQTGLRLDMARNLSFQGRHSLARDVHERALEHFDPIQPNKCEIYSAHCLGMASAMRKDCKLANACRMLNRAKECFSGGDAGKCALRLEEALLQRDLGEREDACKQLQEVYDDAFRCDGDTKLIAADIALEVAWGYVVDGAWDTAEVWFCKAVDLFPTDCSLLAPTVGIAGLAAAQLHLHHDTNTTHLVARAEKFLANFLYCEAAGCQAAHVYLATCYFLSGRNDDAQHHHQCAIQDSSFGCATGHSCIAECNKVCERASKLQR